MNQRTSICLNMIVKNEGAVIERCIKSVLPFISHWVIVDTGSTDNTRELIKQALSGIPGELFERPWRDFAFNRNEALELASKFSEYILWIDADDFLEPGTQFFMPELSADAYSLRISDGGITYERKHIIRSELDWKWKGVLHEFLTSSQEKSCKLLDGLLLKRNHDGARRRDPNTYRNDAQILERALAHETDSFLLARYTFYLAQSYRDAGETAKAIECYLRRSELGFWEEEIYISLVRAGRLMEQHDHPWEAILSLYKRAIDVLPCRAEAYHDASKLCFRNSKNKEGMIIAKPGLDLAPPSGGLFVEDWIYEYGILDEYAINAYWAGAYKDCAEVCVRLLTERSIPDGQRERIWANLKSAIFKFPGLPNLGKAGENHMVARHSLERARTLYSTVEDPAPKVLIAILAKQKEAVLPAFLECIENLNYPKSSIALYVRTNNNTDRTKIILERWLEKVNSLYADIEFDSADVFEKVQNFGVHEWNTTRFKVLGNIRNESLKKATEKNCDFYFVADVDNLLRACTLRDLVSLNLPIVAPMLRASNPTAFYSNYHAEVSNSGYYLSCDQYLWILQQHVTGLIEVPVVHCSYLIRSDIVPQLTYIDESDRHEYVVFSESARKLGIPQYIDNRQIYGYITFDEDAGTSNTPFQFGGTASQINAMMQLLALSDKDKGDGS